MSIALLNKDVLQRVTAFLTIEEIVLGLAVTNHAFLAIAFNDKTWKVLMKRHFCFIEVTSYTNAYLRFKSIVHSNCSTCQRAVGYKQKRPGKHKRPYKCKHCKNLLCGRCGCTCRCPAEDCGRKGDPLDTECEACLCKGHHECWFYSCDSCEDIFCSDCESRMECRKCGLWLCYEDCGDFSTCGVCYGEFCKHCKEQWLLCDHCESLICDSCIAKECGCTREGGAGDKGYHFSLVGKGA